MKHSRTGTSLRFRVLVGSGLMALGLAAGVVAKVETWRHEGAPAFAKGRREGVVISDSGRVRLSQAVRPTRKFDAARVWDLAKTPKGVLYAASGNDGKVFRSTADGDWSVAHDSGDSQAFSLVAMPDGRVFAGSGPGGSVVEVTDPGRPAERPDPKVQYIWDLASDARGNLYAGTGPTGQLWRRSLDGAWSLLLDSKHPHLLCVAVGPDGSVYAGSDGEGLIYRVGPDGKATVLHDAPQNEVRALLVAPDGSLYAGTAADSGRSADGPEPPSFASPRVPGAGATPRPPTPGENSVYRIGPEGIPREVFRHKAMIYALAWRDDRLYVGTGPEGQLFEVRDLGRESTPIARVDHGQILALLADPKDGLLLGAGDPGAVLRLDPGHVGVGTLTSEVLDAKLISRFGTLGWKAERPPGTSVSVKVRTGNVGEADATWSPWSADQTDPSAAAAKVPPGRFAQYQIALGTTDPAATPEVRSITLRYQTANLPPEIAKVDVPDISAGDGATRQTSLRVRWEATDPNGDDLAYSLQIRKDGWPDWVHLGGDPLTEAIYAWDTSAVPDGTYRLRVVATDRPSNPPAEALTRDRVSDPFLVDHQSPAVAVAAIPGGATVTLKDDLTRIVKAAYALDGGDWVPVFPDDGLFDSPAEKITVALPDLKPGTHILMVRATDAAGNVGTGDIVLPSR